MADMRAVIFTEIFKQVLDVIKRPDVPVPQANEQVVAQKVTEGIADKVINQTNNEPLWKSRVLRGALLALGGLAGGYFGLQIVDGDIEALVKAITDIITALGVLYTIYGRLTAKGTPRI